MRSCAGQDGEDRGRMENVKFEVKNECGEQEGME